MNKIKVAELFFSLQGEGRYSGVPSIFLRTFGCNLTCKSFGRTLEDTSPLEYLQIDPDKFTEYNQLPLVKTGCDSYASWDFRFKHLSPMMTTDEIVQRILKLLPFNQWNDEHLVITGGEPLLGWQRAYPDLLSEPAMHCLKELTFETNGTQMLTDDFSVFLESWVHNSPIWNREITFSVSPKLSVSGEKYGDAIKPDVICHFEELGYTYLKFVVQTEDDVKEALEAASDYRDAGFGGPVYIMPVAGTSESYHLNNKTVALLAMKYGLRYSDRLQVPLFKNAWGT